MNSAFELAPGVLLGGERLPLIAGPCVIEDPKVPGRTLEIARRLKDLADRLNIALIFKASFDKANRSSIESYRGPGLEKGLEVLAEVHRETGLPILTDVHQPDQCDAVAEVCHVLQIPAFLCRQTDLLVAAGRTGRTVNIKKGQFLAPKDMRHAVQKVRDCGHDRVVVTERGTTFGYGNLVVDMRSFAMLQDLDIPVIFDVTHSLQLPGTAGKITGGDRRFAAPLAKAGLAAGADGLFMEVHPEPESALSDATTQLDFETAGPLLSKLNDLHHLLRSQRS